MKTALKLLALLALGLVVGAATAQVAAISGQSINQYGQPLPFAQVRVCSATSTTDSSGNCTPTANIFLDFGLTIPAGNPYTADNFGNYVVYAGALAAPNLYTVQLFPASGITWSYVVNGPYCSISGCTFTGPINAPTFNATVSPWYEVNGVQLASTNLLDTGNIAYKNAANVFSASPQTAAIWNATTQFNVAGVQIACTNLSDCANLAKINASNTFTGATNTFNAIVGTTVNATTGYRLAGAAPLNHVLLGNNTNYVDSATIPYSVIAPGGSTGPFAAPGVPCATSTTASTVCTSAQIVTALNASPTTTFSTALLPTVGTANTYPCPSSITTDAFGRAVTVLTGNCAGTSTQTDVTGSRSWASSFHNTTGSTLIISGFTTTPGGSSVGTITCMSGPSTPSLEVWGNEYTATVASAPAAFFCIVPNTYFYALNVSGDIAASPSKWIETTVN